MRGEMNRSKSVGHKEVSKKITKLCRKCSICGHAVQINIKLIDPLIPGERWTCSGDDDDYDESLG